MAILMVVMAFASCEKDSNAKLEGKWRIISVSGYETNSSQQSETCTINVEDKFNYWEFLEDGIFELYYIKEDGDKKYECEGTWTRNGSNVDLKVNGVDVSDGIKVEGTIKQLTASKLVFQMKQTHGEYSLTEVYDCKRE